VSDSKEKILITFTYQPDTVKGPNLVLIGFSIDTQSIFHYYSFGKRRAPSICGLVIFTPIASTWVLFIRLLRKILL